MKEVLKYVNMVTTGPTCDMEPTFQVQLMKKDMSLAVETAKQVGAKLVLADAGLGAYTAASEDSKCRDRDSRVIYRWLGGYEPEVK